MKEASILCKKDYDKEIADSRDRRMAWWREARFGMFIHYGLYSHLETHEWSMAYGNFEQEEYIKATQGIAFNQNAPREWARLAKKAGMKYVILTTRHHDGFSLWDSKVNPYNAMALGPKCDVVKLFAEACRAEGLRIGFYFSLMDWTHPDSWTCAFDQEARLRFTKYLQGMLRELMTGYGKIDILWYDIPRPMTSYEGWDSLAMNQMVRGLQPDIIINDRCLMDEDFGTPEEKIEGLTRDWEACMTFNGISWGYIDSNFCLPYSYNAHQIVRMLCKATAGGGNLLLNIGPRSDGSIPEEAMEPLCQVGAWAEKNADAIYGKKVPTKVYRCNGLCSATEYGRFVYVWNWIWPKERELRLGGFLSRVVAVRELSTNQAVEFDQNERRVILKNLPSDSMETGLHISVFELEFKASPEYARGYLYPQLHQGKQHDYKNLLEVKE